MAGPTPHDLVRVADVADSDDDGRTQRLVTAVSRTILTALNRPSILPRTCTETREVGADGILLANWPATALIGVSRGTYGTPASTFDGLSGGVSLEPADPAPPGRPQLLRLGAFGGRRGPPVTVTYVAGYQVTAEPAQVPSAGPFRIQPAQPYGDWASDVGVIDAAGVPLARVTGAPGPRQYAVDTLGGYTFAAQDQGLSVRLSYGYVPADLANAASDWIRDRIAYAERVGLQSKSLGGQETISYRISAVPDFVTSALAPYTAVVPLC